MVDARQVRYPAAALPPLLQNMHQVHVVRGRHLTTFDRAAWQPEASPALIAALLGPTGNLRAPAIRWGRLLLVGFQPAAYEQWLP